jgi:hypothetical protein
MKRTALRRRAPLRAKRSYEDPSRSGAGLAGAAGARGRALGAGRGAAKDQPGTRDASVGLSERAWRQHLARAQAFSRRTARIAPTPTPQKLDRYQLELIDHLVRSDRTAVSSALLQIAGIDAGEIARRAVLERVSEAACWAQADGAISQSRAAQIARHVKRALQRTDVRLAA